MTKLSTLTGGELSPPSKKTTARKGRSKATAFSEHEQFFRAALSISDEKDADAKVQQKAEAIAHEHCPDYQYYKDRKSEIDPRYDMSQKRIDKLEERLAATPRKIKNNQSDRGEDGKSFLKWKRSDQVGMLLLNIALLCALVTGASNAFVALYSSGSVIFIEKPWIAVLISVLVPTGGIALKFITNFLHYDLTKKRFAIGMYVVTALLLFSWSIVFASEFAAANAGIDWENLGESNGKSNLLNWLQLTSELLLATCLSLAIESIYTKYRPDGEITNPEFINISEDLDIRKKEHEVLKQEKEAVDEAYSRLYHEFTSIVLDIVVAYQALRARYEQAQNF